MSTKPQARKASLRDVPSIAPLFDAYRCFYGRRSDLKRVQKFLSDRLRKNESVIYFVRLSRSGPPVGFTQLYPTYSSVSMGPIWVLNDLFVAPEARRSGIARLLIEAAHLHARKTNALRVVLSTAHSNRKAQALYESIGYVRDQEFRTYSFEIASKKRRRNLGSGRVQRTS